VGSHQSRVEGQNHFPQPAGHTAFDAAEGLVGLLGFEHLLSARVQLFIHQYHWWGPEVLCNNQSFEFVRQRFQSGTCNTFFIII